MSELLRRQAAVEATLAKFRDRPIKWGVQDCMRMARFHLIQMGHKPPPLPPYRTLLGAQKAMAKAGGLIAVFDRLLPAIAPARMLLGDIAVLEGDGGDATFICAGTKLIGWHQDSDVLVNVTALEIKGAWRA